MNKLGLALLTYGSGHAEALGVLAQRTWTISFTAPIPSLAPETRPV